MSSVKFWGALIEVEGWFIDLGLPEAIVQSRAVVAQGSDSPTEALYIMRSSSQILMGSYWNIKAAIDNTLTIQTNMFQWINIYLQNRK